MLKYKEEFLSLLQLLHNKTFSKRGFSWNGILSASLLLTLTHTYPLENKFVNSEEWDNDSWFSLYPLALPMLMMFRLLGFSQNHHLFWGKLYRPEDVKVRSINLKVDLDLIILLFKIDLMARP